MELNETRLQSVSSTTGDESASNAHKIERNAPHIGAGDPPGSVHADAVHRDRLHQRFR